MKNFHLIFVLFLGLLASCSGKGEGKKNKEKPPVTVEVMIAGKQEFVSIVEVNGTVLSNEMVELHPEVSGRIVYLNVVDGGLVNEGMLLVRINDAELQAQLEQQKNQLDLAKKTEQRYKSLLAVNGINQSDYDVALSQLNNYQALVNVTLAQIDKTMIKAPFSGKLGLRQQSPGAYVTPQSVIATLQQSDRVKIDFTLPESYNNMVNIGDTVNIQSNLSNEVRKAKVVAIEPQINTSTRNIKARAMLLGKGLNPGSFVKVMLNKKSAGILVPSNVIIPDALSNQVVLVKNNKAKFINVETGIRTADGVELISGIKDGDSIVVSGILFLRPDTKVNIKKIKQLR